MRPAGTQERFLRTPIGAWVAGPCFLVWNWSAQLGGSVVWGRPSEDDFNRLFTLVDAYHRLAPGCDVVTDVSRIDSVEGTAYSALMENMRRRAALFSTGVRRHAMVRSDGLLGALAEGFFPLLGATHTWRVFPDREAAFSWMDRPDAARASQEVARLVDEARGLSPQLRQLRDYIKTHLLDARLPVAARALGLSERTLHRMLQEANTGFRDQLAAARVDTARRLLAETELKVEEVARRVGCCSPSHLTSLFKRTTGQSPVAYRNEIRKAAGRRSS